MRAHTHTLTRIQDSNVLQTPFTDKSFISKTIPSGGGIHIHWYASIEGLVRMDCLQWIASEQYLNSIHVAQKKPPKKSQTKSRKNPKSFYLLQINSCLFSDLYSIKQKKNKQDRKAYVHKTHKKTYKQLKKKILLLRIIQAVLFQTIPLHTNQQ